MSATVQAPSCRRVLHRHPRGVEACCGGLAALVTLAAVGAALFGLLLGGLVFFALVVLLMTATGLAFLGRRPGTPAGRVSSTVGGMILITVVAVVVPALFVLVALAAAGAGNP